MENPLNILVHGFNKDNRDMAFLEKGLRKSGFETLSVNLPTLFGSLEQCREEMARQVEGHVAKYPVVNYAAHSMGGLITREYLRHTGLNNTGRCVFIATPHAASGLAGIAGRIPLYSKIFKTLIPIMPDSGYEPPTLPEGVQLGIIAGNRNRHLLGRMFLPPASDGRIKVSSAGSPDAEDFVVLPYAHKEIHHQQETLDLVQNFLSTGTFVIS